MLSRNRQYPVKEIWSHFFTDEDELNARAQVRRFGRTVFPGIETATLRLGDAGIHERQGDRILEEKHCLPIGIFGGTFDEHGPNGQRAGSAALLMANWLYRNLPPAIEQMMRYSVRADSKSLCTPFEWGFLVKAWWEAGYSQDRVVQLYDLSFDGLYHFLNGRPTKRKPDVSFGRLLAEWIGSKVAGDKSVPKKIRNVVDALQYYEQSDNRAFSQVLDLGGLRNVIHDFGFQAIWLAILASGATHEAARDFVTATLDAKYLTQVEYLRVLQEFPSRAEHIKHSGCRITVLESDSLQALRAARNSKPAPEVFIQFLSTGSVSVFDVDDTVDLKPVVGNLRDLENHTQGRSLVPYWRRRDSGTLRECPEWFHWMEGSRSKGVFSKPKKAPGRPKTQLTKEQVIKAVCSGLEGSLTKVG